MKVTHVSLAAAPYISCPRAYRVIPGLKGQARVRQLLLEKTERDCAAVLQQLGKIKANGHLVLELDQLAVALESSDFRLALQNAGLLVREGTYDPANMFQAIVGRLVGPEEALESKYGGHHDAVMAALEDLADSGRRLSEGIRLGDKEAMHQNMSLFDWRKRHPVLECVTLDLSYVAFERAAMVGVDFSGMFLAGIDFSIDARHGSPCLAMASFERAYLQGAIFYRVDLELAHFASANCQGADFTHAKIERTFFWKTNLSRATLPAGAKENLESLAANGQVNIENAVWA